MKAKESDKDRRKIWSDSRAENFDLIQCIRVVTCVLNNRFLFILQIIAKNICT